MAVHAYSKSEIDIGLNLKSDTVDTYQKAEVNVALSILQAGKDRRVLINAVDINGNFNINATPNAILKNKELMELYYMVL